MKTAMQILQQKAVNQAYSISSDQSVYDALTMLADKNVGALLVIDQDRLVGIFSERDYARKVALMGKSSAQTTVATIMSTHLIVVGPDTPYEECMALMTERHIRHLPVMDQEKILGILSIGDLVKVRISEQEYVIKQLEQYIYTIPEPNQP
jgi:CBS domain-containing protein